MKDIYSTTDRAIAWDYIQRHPRRIQLWAFDAVKRRLLDGVQLDLFEASEPIT